MLHCILLKIIVIDDTRYGYLTPMNGLFIKLFLFQFFHSLFSQLSTGFMATVCDRKAVGKANQSPSENEELLKSLGTQLNVHFSKYDQWQRRQRTAKSSISTEKCPGKKHIS